MSCRIALAIMFLMTLSAGALAQSAAPKDQTQPAASSVAPAPDTGESMNPPMVGDHWTYELRDEITGDVKNTLNNTITDVTPSEIAVRIANQAYSQGPSVLIYD